MLKKRIIPCLDVDNGRVVKGVNFENLIDAGDPIEQAKYYYNQGADEICFLDITATHQRRDTIFDMVEKVAKNCFIPFTVGGGVKNIEDFSKLMLCGADKISVNSGALNNPSFLTQAANKFGSQAVIIAIDAKKSENGEYEIYSHGGRKSTGINALEWAIKAQNLGAGEILLTSMDKDGTKSGYDTQLLNLICNKVSIPVIASGGVGKVEDFEIGANHGADGLLAASIFHFREKSIDDVKNYLKSKNIAVRI